ncbi:MAG: hypothetical protein ACRDOY_03150 [Nocardioidaceae bacterium]
MRWEDLFTDLEREWEAVSGEERRAETVERTRAELARLDLRGRLRGSEGRQVRLDSRCGRVVCGELTRVGADFVLVAAFRHECVLPIRALGAVSGLGGEVVPEHAAGPVRSRLGLGSVLRRICTDRSPVTVVRTGDQVSTGTLQRVGSDFLELAEHPLDEILRAEHLRSSTLVPFAALVMLRREAPSAAA